MAPQEKTSKYGHLPLSTSGPLECALTGTTLLNHPFFNKGSAHPKEERQTFNLTGLLPQSVQTLEQQAHRAYEQYSTRPNDLAKNTFMTSLKEQNEILFYKLLYDHLEEMFSIIYTPTEGDAIQNYSRLFRRPEGCFLNINDADRVHNDLAQWGRPEDIDYIVVTDGEEILGIGDQGCGGILISVAKLVLTTLCAGIHPNRTLPVVLDCGTDNEELLKDDLYLGLRSKRIRGERYDKFVDSFVQSARKLYPRAYIHFEDFGLDNDAIVTESKISKEDAAKQLWLIDKPGLLTTETPLNGAQKFFARSKEEWDGKSTDLLAVIKEVKPNVLIGTSTKPGSFTEDVVKEMASHVDRPIIMPLSNPTRLHEAVPKDILKWTEGRALVATGSPFEPVKGPWGKDGKEVTIKVAECNNSVVFPGIGLGSVLSRSKLVTDKMLVAAVEAVAEMSPALKDSTAPLLPGVDIVRDVSVNVASKVIRAAVKDGLATEKGIPDSDEDLKEWIREQMWNPEYRPLKYTPMEVASRQAKGQLKTVGTLEN
ncbi:NAD-dependent malic enzyme, mitochondrial [Diaporthe eres]